MLSVEDEWERELESEEDLDLLFVSCDFGKVTLEQLQATIKEHGFEAVQK